MCRGIYARDYKKYMSRADVEELEELERQGQDIPTRLKDTIDYAKKLYMAVADEINKMVENGQEQEARKQYPDVFYYADIVKNCVVSIGSHPCGMIVSPVPLEGLIGTCTSSKSAYPISQLYMKEVDSLNLVKLDLLKLDTIEIINNTCQAANIPRLTPDNMDINDEKVWTEIRNDTTAIFQWESGSAQNYIKQMLSDESIRKFQKIDKNVDKMMLLTIGNSAIRPAGASYRDDLANGVIRTTGAKPIDDFLKPTFGYLVFQEQIIAFLNGYCGFTMGEADLVRRHFSKKQPEEIQHDIPVIRDGGYMRNLDGSDKTDHYIDGFAVTMKKKYGLEKKEADEMITAFLQVILDASNYLFSQNHSTPYSFEGYACGWLRTYYPLEFLSSAMESAKDNEAKTIALTSYAKKHGIHIEPPKFRYSKAEYFFDKSSNSIYKGIESVKGLNKQVGDQIFEMRDQKFEDFVDVLVYLKENTAVDRGKIIALIRINFFEEFGDIRKLEWITEKFYELYGKKSFKKNNLGYLTEDMIRPFARAETYDQVKEIDCERAIKLAEADEETIKKCYKRSKSEKKEFSTKNTIKALGLTDDKIRMLATKVTPGQFTDVDLVGLLKHLLSLYKGIPIPVAVLLKYQKEYMGYIGYTDPKYPKSIVVVTQLDTKYSPKFKAYCLANGQTAEMKIHRRLDRRDKSIKTSWADTPLSEGDVINMVKCKQRPKIKKVEDHWEQVPGVYDWWVDEYRIMVM